MASYKEEKYIKTCMAEALLELMKEYPFDEITVNEICYTAHIGRATYYNYVNSKHGKEELISHKLKKDYDAYREKLIKENHPKKYSADNVIYFVYENKELFKLIDSNHLSNCIIELIQYIISTNAEQREDMYLNSYVIFGYMGIIYQWLRSGFNKSPEEVNKTIANAYIDGINTVIEGLKQSNNGEVPSLKKYK